MTDPAVLGFTLLLAAALLAIAVWDARAMRIPDFLSLPLVAAGLVAAWTVSTRPVADHLIGAAAGYAALALVAWIYKRARGRDGLGMGDAKLLAASGAWLGWAALPSLVLLAAFTGLLLALARAAAGRAQRGAPLPFGPHLAFATLAVWLAGPLFEPPVWR